LNSHWTSKDESQLIGIRSKERIPLQSHWPRQEVHFWEKEGLLKGVGNSWAHLVFSMRIWDVFGVRREVKHSQEDMRVIMKRKGK
jgi:hypothetical protein